LHPYIEDVIAWQPDVVINVGCAEGYYSTGLAKRLPSALVVAYDMDPKAQEACKEACHINGIELEIRGFCTASELRERTETAARPFMFIDCEGGERQLLLTDDYRFPNAKMIVECHDFVDRDITFALLAKFSNTHEISKIPQGGRDPFSHTSLSGLSNDDRWGLVSERRPETMHWLFMAPK
jgi:tRNA G37 N-methylase Trm5